MPHRQKYLLKVFAAAAFCALGVLAVAEHYVTEARVAREVVTLREVVAQFGGKYPDLKAVHTSHPKALVVGTVPSQADFEVVRLAVLQRLKDPAETERVIHFLRIEAESKK